MTATKGFIVNRSRVILVSLLSLVLLTIGITLPSSASAAPTSQAVVFVYDASGGVLNSAVRAAVRSWDKAGSLDLQFVKNPCFGASCIVVDSVVAHPDGTCGNTMGGCEFTYPEEFGLCHVTVTDNLDGRLAEAVTTHEVGHCLGMPHISLSDDPKTIMSPVIDANDYNRVPSQQDIALLEEMWADGYQAPAA